MTDIPAFGVRPSSRVTHDDYVGTTLASRYKLVATLAEGSQARVYLAEHTLIGRMVAVKILLPMLASDQALVARFLNEGRAAGTLGHPNIVESLDMGFAPDGCPFLVMELLEGRTLAQEIELAGPLPVGRAVYIATQIASAVALANERGIVHRDLKPENVMLVERDDRRDHVKVYDFGISKFEGVGTMVTTSKGQLFGTPGFMAPEQLEDPGSVDARADVYGLGAVLYDMLTGAPPFDSVEFPKVLRFIAEEQPKRLLACRPGLPQDLVDIIECSMNKSPSARFQKMSDLEEALLPFAAVPELTPGRNPSYRPRSAPVPPKTVQSNLPAPLVHETLSGPPQPSGAQRRGIGVWLVACVLALAFLASLALGFFARNHAPAPLVSPLTATEVPPAGATAASTATIQAAPTATLSPPTPSPAVDVRAPISPSLERPSHPLLPRPVGPSSGAAQAGGRRASPLGGVLSAAPATATATPTPSQIAPNAALNCDPPYYFEGSKKLFKPGCL